MARTRTTIIWVSALALLLLIGSVASATGTGGPERQSADVLTFAGFEPVEGATARLARSEDALLTRTDTRELDHGHVLTLWWVVFNHPENCEHGAGEVACGEADLFDGSDGPTGVDPSCVYGGGSLVGGNGHARFTDRLSVGDVRDSCIDFFAAAVPDLEGTDHGLTNPEGAEVHLVVRSHGPRIPGQVAAQRTTFAGGCEEFLPAGATHGLDAGQCSDLQFAILPPPPED
jgi:hypothetical protein